MRAQSDGGQRRAWPLLPALLPGSRARHLIVGLLVTLMLAVVLWTQVGAAYAVGFAALGVGMSLVHWRRLYRTESLARSLGGPAGGPQEVAGPGEYERVGCAACRGTGKQPLAGEAIILAAKAKGSLSFVTPRCPVCGGSGWILARRAGERRVERQSAGPAEPMATAARPEPRRPGERHEPKGAQAPSAPTPPSPPAAPRGADARSTKS